jgi:hypothetical protein
LVTIGPAAPLSAPIFNAIDRSIGPSKICIQIHSPTFSLDLGDFEQVRFSTKIASQGVNGPQYRRIPSLHSASRPRTLSAPSAPPLNRLDMSAMIGRSYASRANTSLGLCAGSRSSARKNDGVDDSKRCEYFAVEGEPSLWDQVTSLQSFKNKDWTAFVKDMTELFIDEDELAPYSPSHLQDLIQRTKEDGNSSTSSALMEYKREFCGIRAHRREKPHHEAERESVPLP